jgi:uncharacterized protein (TIGR03435 family)
MTPRVSGRISFGRKSAWTFVAMAAVAGPLLFRLVNPRPVSAQAPPTTPEPSFEVASIKPDRSGERRCGFGLQPARFTTTNVTAKMLITFAYNVRDFQVAGGSPWIDSEAYDIDAKEEDSVVERLQKLSNGQKREQIGLMVQSLLADRFKLKVTHGTKDLPVYALVVAKNGPKLQAAKGGDTHTNGINVPNGRAHAVLLNWGTGQITGRGIPMTELAEVLSQQTGRTVLDRTGLKGKYNFSLRWNPDDSGTTAPGQPGAGPQPDNPPPPDSSGPSIFTAIQEQLGLKLESTKGPVEVLVIEHIERPSEN